MLSQQDNRMNITSQETAAGLTMDTDGTSSGVLAADRDHFSFLSLPPEIRNRIFSHVWADGQPIAVFCDHPTSAPPRGDYKDREGK